MDMFKNGLQNQQEVGVPLYESSDQLHEVSLEFQTVGIYPIEEGPLDLYVADLMHISRVCWSEIGADPWTMLQFYTSYPQKFNLSFYAEVKEQKVGMLIATEPGHFSEEVYGDTGHLKIAYINKLAVLPEFRGGLQFDATHHVAYALMNQFVQKADSLGYDMIRLSVDKQNRRAQNFYERFGFTYQSELIIDVLPMWVMELPLR